VKLLHRPIEVSPFCKSVQTYEGVTYAECDNGVIDRIDGNYKVTKSFITIKGEDVWSISAHNDRIYTLSSISTARVHDLKAGLMQITQAI